MSFGEVRSVLQGQPNKKSWAKLCDLLDGFDPHELDDMILPYVEGASRRWPAALCVTPKRWITRALGGQEVPFWSVARALDLSNAYLSEAQTMSLLASDRLEHIQLLIMDSNRIGPQGAEALGRSSSLRALTSLRLGFNGIGDQGWASLVKAPFLATLQHLSLEDNNLTGDSVKLLVKQPWVDRLVSLDLRRNKLGAEAMTMLASASLFELKRLNMDRNHLAYMSRLHTFEGFECLERLDMTSANLTDKGLESLAQCQWLSTVEVLDISGNSKITRKGLGALVDSPYTESLKVLHLNGLGIIEEDVVMLRTLPALQRYSFRSRTIEIGGPFDPYA